jgi:hypothetical protein
MIDLGAPRRPGTTGATPLAPSFRDMLHNIPWHRTTAAPDRVRGASDTPGGVRVTAPVAGANSMAPVHGAAAPPRRADRHNNNRPATTGGFIARAGSTAAIVVI